MSSKFNSSTMLNKTPPICQKHQPEPSLPPTTVFQILRATLIIVHPTEEPTETWTQILNLQRVAPPNIYLGETIDNDARRWFIEVRFDADWLTWRYNAIVADAVPVVSVAVPVNRATMRPFPIDSGLLTAENIQDCDTGYCRVTV